MLERLAQDASLEDTLLVSADIPPEMAVEDAFIRPPLGWGDKDRNAVRYHGSEWLRSKRTAILRVPSVVVPRECNYIVNPDHPLSASIVQSSPEPLIWDDRLFASREA